MNADYSHQKEARYAEWVIRWRWPIMIACVLLALAAASGGRFLAFSTDYRVFFGEENPQLIAFDELQNTYTKIDNILFVLENRSEDAFASETLSAVEELTEQAWQLPYSIRVDSISNFQHTRSERDDLIVEDLIEDGVAYTDEKRAAVRAIALDEPLLKDRLISSDASVTGINVTLQMPEKTMDEVPIATAAAREMARHIEQRYPGIKVHLTGVVLLNNAFMESSMNDMSTLVPMMYLAIVVMMFLLLRSITATIGVMIVVTLSIMTAMGLAGWSGIKLTPPSSAAPTIIMTLAVADGIHMLISMISVMRHDMDKRAALKESMRLNLQPIFLTSVTTAIGFLSMNFSDAPPFHDLGNIAAVGVMAAFVYSATFLPAFLAVLPVKASAATGRYGRAMDSLADFVVKRHSPLLWGGIALSVVIVSMIPRNEFNDQFLEYFDDSMAFRMDSDFAIERLSGIYQIQYSLPASEAGGISDPKFLTKSQHFVDWLRSQPEVTHVNTLNDTFKRLNKNLHGDDRGWYKLPDQRDLAAQYLLLYEMSLPYGLDLNNQINVDKSKTQVIATLKELDTTELKAFARKSEQWLAENTPAIATTGIGPTIMFAYIVDRNIKGMFKGTLTALVLISMLILLALKNVRIGFVSLLPNLLPAGLAFGLWGLFVGQVNMGVTMVVGMTLGIIVDDTVHFLSKYLRARREQGFGTEAAVRYAFSSVGIALVVTSLILIGGFAVLGQSSFGMNAGMAQLTMIAVIMALAADFLVLPPLLMWLDRGRDMRASDVGKTIQSGSSVSAE
ncbi:MAG: MMPL family transporter [Pseudomonadota bacterium]